MKAMVCEAFGGPEVLALRDVPDPPPPGPGEITMRSGFFAAISSSVI